MRAWIVVLLLPLAGCLDGDGASEPTPVDEGPAPLTTAPLTSYLHNVSQPIAGLSMDNAVIENIRTGITETIQLDSWIARPAGEGPFPLVLEVTPYYGGGNPSDPANALGGWNTMHHTLIERGYAVGISSVRGTGNSGGCFTQGGPEEAVDTAKVIEHLAGLPWSNGNVGLIGVSYPGTTPQDVWVQATPSLKAVVPISGISDLYKYNFVNGVPINIQGFGFNTYYWAIVGLGPAGLSGGTQPLGDPTHVATAVAGEACPDQADVQSGGVTSTADGNKDAYWQVRDFGQELRDSPDKNADRAAVWYIHGLQDWNVKPHMMEDWIEDIQATGVPFKAWLGQWGHAWPGSRTCGDSEDNVGAACRGDWWDEAMVAWFDQFLLDKETGIMDAPAVQVQDDRGVWRHEATWPPETANLRLHFGQGTLGGPSTGSVSYFDGRGGLPALPGDPEITQAVWRSEPFAADTTISGLPVFHGNVTASGMRASLVLSMQTEDANGERRSFNFCIQSLNHVDSIESGAMDISGQTQEVQVRCFPQDDVIQAGHRLVIVASGNTVGSPAPGIQPISDGSTITIDLDGAWIDLPVDASRVVEDPQPYKVLLA
ncbi:MAG: CocE/NonD family hydrolase [Thermoplasmatota archaeon]